MMSTRIEMRDPWRRDAAPSQNIRQNSGALHILNHQRNHNGQLRLAQRMGQCTRPVDIIDSWMRILVVRQVNVLHGKDSQLVGAHRITTVFHISSDGEQLARGHDVGGRIDNNLVGRFEGDRIVFAEGQCIQGAIGRILGGALECEISRA